MTDEDILRVRDMLASFSKKEIVLIAESLLISHCDYDMEKIEIFIDILNFASRKGDK